MFLSVSCIGQSYFRHLLPLRLYGFASHLIQFVNRYFMLHGIAYAIKEELDISLFIAFTSTYVLSAVTIFCNLCRNAFGPSFGTVCFSGMVMGVVRIVRAIVDSVQREENAPGFVNVLLNCCARFLLSAFDFVNKFTVNFAAITGEAYCTSAKMTYELLKRNLLSAVFVETVSTRILAGIIFVLSTLYAIVVFAILKGINKIGVESYFIAAIAWLLLIVVLGYFVHVLDNVIDTIYVCYAIDRDRGDVSKQEVHEVYVMLPISRNHRPSLADGTPTIV